MRWVRFRVDGREGYGVVEGQIVELIEGNMFGEYHLTGQTYKLEEIRLLAPCVPSKIICVGLNYVDHAREFNLTPPVEPVLFLKPPTSVIGQGDDIVYPSMSRRVDFEAELAVVIKGVACRVPEAEANSVIFGYTCANDVTARDLQKTDGQWTRAKSFDTFCPLGPEIVTDVDPNSLEISLTVNGLRKQSSNTSRMIFSVARLISFVSNIMTLLPGDVLLTGTPSGVGPVRAGDEIAVRIEEVGILKNRVVTRENLAEKYVDKE